MLLTMGPRLLASLTTLLVLALLPPVAAVANSQAEAAYTVRTLPLGPTPAGGISMDYLAYDPATGFVWAPAGNTGIVAVVDGMKVTPIGGFPTRSVEFRGRQRTLGPTAATVGEGVVYIGNRGDSKICAVDARSLTLGACGEIDSMPDGLASVPTTREVWVTAPRDRSIRILDGSTLAEKAKLAFEGSPEGFAVDGKRRRFYTNLEDQDRTLAIDLGTHETVASWPSSCGEEGPRGLRVDQETGYLFVACSDRIEVLDAAHDGAVLSSLDTGDGVDDPDYDPTTHLLYVAAAGAARLTIARVDSQGHLTLVATVPTGPGFRNAAVTRQGTVYLAHSMAAESNDLIVVSRSD
jgi:DNA-binding beta-propeller fold protein YncE